MVLLLRFLLTFNATSLLVVVYQVKAPFLFADARGLLLYFFGVILVLIPLGLTGVSVLVSRGLGKDSFEEGDVVAVEFANNSFLPSYLGYFFVALSIPNLPTLVFVYGLLFIFTFMSQALYFNPLFLILGYKFYNLTTAKGSVVFLISKSNFRTPGAVIVPEASRINGYTFLEWRKK